MKKLTRIAALLLVLVLAVSLCACGGSTSKQRDKDSEKPTTTAAPTTAAPTTEKPTEPPTDPLPVIDDALVGSWRYEVDLTEVIVATMAASLGVELTDEPEKCICPMYLSFEADGSCKMEIDTEEFGTAAMGFLKSIIPYMVEITYQQGEAQGVDRAAMEQQIQDAYGMSIAEFYEATFAEMDPEDLMGDPDDLNLKGTFTVDGDHLYIVAEDETLKEDDYVVYKVEDDTFSITEFGGDENAFSDFEEYGIELPMVFERAD